MLLYLSCPAAMVEDLEAAQELESDPRLGWVLEAPSAYEWLSGLMRERVTGYKGPSLWWAWYRIDSGQVGAPPLDHPRLHLFPTGVELALITLEVPDQEVLLTNWLIWNMMLDQATWRLNDEQRQHILDLWSGGILHYLTDIKPGTEAVQGTFAPLRWRDVRDIAFYVSHGAGQ